MLVVTHPHSSFIVLGTGRLGANTLSKYSRQPWKYLFSRRGAEEDK